MKLQIKDLSFSYRRRPVLRGVSFGAESGEITAVLGANAVGKSTLLKCLAGALIPEGQILYDSRSLKDMDSSRRARLIGYMVQDSPSPAELTVVEKVLLGRLQSLTLHVAPEELARVYEILEALHIAPLAQQRLSRLSGGQRRMVSVAQTLVRQPEILLLDEPTANLDMLNELEVLRLMADMTRQRNLVTIVTLHDLNMAARYAARCVLLCGGRVIAAGTPQETLTEKNIEDAYGVKAKIISDVSVPVIIPSSPAAEYGT